MAKPRPVVTAACASAAPSTSYASAFLPPPASPSDGDLLRSLHRLARDLSAAYAPAPFLRAAFASVSRRARLLAAAFDDLLLCAAGEGDLLPRSASLCLREVLLVLQRFKAVVADCAARSRTLLLLQSDEMDAELRDLHHDLATLLDLLPVVELGLADDVMDLLALASRQCRRCASAAEPEPALKTTVLSLIEEIEREIVPERERLEEILEEVGINDPASCSDEIDSLEREIGDRASERWTAAMIALVGLLRYAKCVLFSATPRPSDSKADVDVEDDGESPAPPPDLRCPISLDLMRDPVVAASGQTYDRESIDRWFSSGKSTCPKTGQVLANLELVPNKSLKNLISKWCRENGVAMEVCEASKSEQAQAVAANKAALEVARMTASYLVKKLSISFSPDAANRVVHEIRLLSKSGSDNRAFVGEAGAVPMLVPLLYSEDAGLQLNAVTALLNLSILEANKKRIMHADGAVEAVTHIMSSGTTWRAKENAAAAVLSLAAVHTYRRRLGRNPSVVEKLVHLVRTGPTSTKKDALAALLSLAGERENVGKLVEAGVVEAALATISDDETAAAVLAALAKRGGAEAIVKIDGAVARLVAEMRRGTEWARESATAALVLLCRRLGSRAVTQVMGVPGVEWAIWELMGTGTDRARRKAASLGRICRRWAAASAADGERGAECPASSVVPPAMMAS
ncbi:U-box domain-containing protein 16-like [Hordeum vulgare]|uniref:RING-type E3 ubiquitin transferase n=1 Tax=Hordeum vulgare subsp. vulgare TaxID=112509 RepID=A0A8I6XQ44_HORVV|nr:U-box domain-containing protein 16-like [Hordeum vulgare subsp. vulgare]KAE8790180.1 U-box domain-containing protein 16-like [Hordeum vulgare]